MPALSFSDTTNDKGLVQECDFLAGTNANSYPLKDKARSANNRLGEIWSIIFNAFGGWQFDDDNENDLPEATQNLTASTEEYTLPAAALTVIAIDIKNSGGSWIRLHPITPQEIRQRGQATDGLFTSEGQPMFYRLVQDKIKLLPTPDYSSTNGLKVFFDRDMTEFSASDTTKTPGFASAYHWVLAVGMALDYVKVNGPESRKKNLEADWARGIAQIASFYSQRFRDMFPPRLIPHGARARDYRDSYE